MDKKITVQNRSGSVIGYRLPEINLSRTFAPDEEKQIPADELQKLAYQAGGQELIDAYLLIKDTEIATEISPLVSKEPEYNLNSDAVVQLLKNGTIDEFLDVLDFAPLGVIELIKKLSISLPCTDTLKLDAIKERYGMDIHSIIEMNRPEPEETVQEKPQRRVVKEEATEAPVRRTNAESFANKYTVINRK